MMGPLIFNKRPMSTICLSTAYLAPVSYYTQLMAGERVVIEQCENYVKQTYRNRALIATASGVMPLTIPVEHKGGEKILMRDLRISDHGNWRHLHWQALQAAYDKSPFFEYYADDFRPFYEGRPTHYLLEFNQMLQQLVCSLLNLNVEPQLTQEYEKEGDFIDLRYDISPKKPCIIANPEPYYQVFAPSQGFLSDLSIVDLLFNMGPEALLVLKKQCGEKSAL